MAVTLLITGYYRHPKMMLANSISGGENAEVLWARALDYVNEYGTDGFVPAGMPLQLCPTKTTARVKGLVTAGLWNVVEGGWRVHDYNDWNRTAAERAKVEREKSEAKSRAGKKGAAVRWGGRLHRPGDGSCHAAANGTAMADAWHSDSPGPGPGSGPVVGVELEEDVDVELENLTGNVNVQLIPPAKHDDPGETAAARAAIARAVAAWGMDDAPQAAGQ